MCSSHLEMNKEWNVIANLCLNVHFVSHTKCWVFYECPLGARGFTYSRKIKNAKEHSGYHKSASAALELLEWSLTWIQTGTSNLFPNNSQFRDLTDQEPLWGWSLHTAFLFWRLEEVSGLDEIPLCQLASEGSARPVIDVATTSTWSERLFL